MKIKQVITCLALALLTGCSLDAGAGPQPLAGSTEQEPTFPAADTPPVTSPALPALPDGWPPRSVDALEPLVLFGVEALLHSGDITFGATSLSLQPDAGELAYAVYQFPVGGFEFDAIDFVITPNNPGKTWYAVSDYDRGRWRPVQSEAGATSLPLPPGRFVSDNGYCYFAVIAHDETDTVIQQVSIDLDVPVWDEYVLAESGQAGEALALAQIGSSLYLAYATGAADELRLARSTGPMPACPADWSTSTVLSGITPSALALAEVNALPAVAAVNSQSGAVNFLRAISTTPAGETDWVAAFPAQTAEPGCIGLAEVAGRPAVAYVDPGLMMQSIDYAYAGRAGPAVPADWTITEAVTNDMMPPFDEFSYVSLLTNGSLPVLVYFNESAGRLEYLYTDLAEPIDASSWTRIRVDDTGAGAYCRAAVCAGLPVLVYADTLHGHLRFAGATGWTPGSGDWNRSVIDLSGSVSGPLSVAALNPGLAVAYHDHYNQRIRYAWTGSDNPGGSRDWRIVTVAENAGTGGEVALAVPSGGTPLIAYHNTNTGAIVVACITE